MWNNKRRVVRPAICLTGATWLLCAYYPTRMRGDIAPSLTEKSRPSEIQSSLGGTRRKIMFYYTRGHHVEINLKSTKSSLEHLRKHFHVSERNIVGNVHSNYCMFPKLFHVYIMNFSYLVVHSFMYNGGGRIPLLNILYTRLIIFKDNQRFLKFTNDLKTLPNYKIKSCFCKLHLAIF